ncbi:MAG: hypothetical protein FWH32_04990 [Clostridiales bacterium]|nr:hypothetical protein [Clostridiales bacterium]
MAVTLGVSSFATDYSFVRWDVTPSSVTWATGSATTQNSSFVMPAEDVTVTPVYLYAPSYNVTLNQATGGTATRSPARAAEGDSVTLNIDSLVTNYSFVRWDVMPSTPPIVWTTGSATTPSATFNMPASAVTVTPVYHTDMNAITLRQATGGTATASPRMALADETITLGISSLRANYSFVRWDVSPAVTWTAGDETTQAAAFTMPNSTVSVRPVYRDNTPAPPPPAATAQSGGSPRTSDDTNMPLWWLLFAYSASGLAIIGLYHTRRRLNN